MINFNQIFKDENDTKTKIFYTAARLFAEKGYNGVSMREISEKSGISKPMIYYYFGNKEGIYRSLLEFGLNQGIEKAKKISNLPISSKLKLIKLIQTRFQLSCQFPEFAKFFLSIFITTEKLPFIANLKTKAKQHRQIFINVIQEGVESGEFGVGANPELAVEIIMSVLAHFVTKQLKIKKKILSDKLAEDIVELLFKGLNE